MAAVEDGVLIDPAGARCVGTNRRMNARRKLPGNLLEVFGHARARPVKVRAILENDKDVRIAEHGLRSHAFDVRSRQQRGDDRISHLVLDHVRGLARPGRVDDHLHVADVGQRVERRLPHGPHAGNCEQNGSRKNDEGIAAAPLNDSCDHHMPPAASTLSCFVARVWPPRTTATVTCQVPPEPSCRELE